MLRHRSDFEKLKEMMHLNWPTGCLHHLGEMRVFKLEILKKRKSCLVLDIVNLFGHFDKVILHSTDECKIFNLNLPSAWTLVKGSKNHTNFAALLDHSSVLT